MIRVLLWLIVVALLSFGAVWLADRPGDVLITWQGRRVETSVMVLIFAIAAVAVATVMVWSFIRTLLRSPDYVSQYLRNRRGARGYRAVSHGLIAVGSGDARAAKKFSAEANRIAPNEPLTLLLNAQAAQLSGNREAAAATFDRMAGRDDTRVLGLHGLFVEARRRQDPGAALFYAEEAAKQTPVPNWAGQAVLEFRCIAGDWSGALTRLERNMKSGLIDKVAYRRQRAVLLTAQAIAAAEGDALAAAGKAEVASAPNLSDIGREQAKTLALEAVKLAPGLVPSAALAGRLLGEAGDRRKAARILEAAWRINPHPDLADAYAHLRPGDSARERLARVQALAGKTPGDIEGALAVARAALDAREFTIAREVLAPLVPSPTQRVAALMAALEMQQGDEGRGREWMARALNARRDPAWTADGFVSDRWLPVSPVTGRLDAFEWKDPLAGRDHAGAIIDAEQRAMLDAPRPAVTGPAATAALAGATLAAGAAAAAQAASTTGEGTAPRADVAPPPVIPAASAPAPGMIDAAPPAAAHSDGDGPERATAAFEASPEPAMPPAPPVIPLVHAPDDPGPEAAANSEEPEPDPPSEPPPGGWNRFRSFFGS
jgi:HemY protein